MREVQLPSGAVLKITEAPFLDAKALYQAVLAEFKGVPVANETEKAWVKELICIGFSSLAIERCLWKCLDRCTYHPAGVDAPEKIAPATFDPVERREDWIKVCMEVAQDNIAPFMKSLYALFSQVLAVQKSPLESRQPTNLS